MDSIPRLERNVLTAALSEQLPVNDSVPVQEHQSRRDLCGIKTGPRLIELPRALNLKHEVASIDVLHHKEQPVLWREVELESAQSVFWPFLGQVQNCIFLPAHLKNTEYSLLSHTYILKSLLKATNGDSIKEQPLLFNVNVNTCLFSFTFLSKVFIQKRKKKIYIL